MHSSTTIIVVYIGVMATNPSFDCTSTMTRTPSLHLVSQLPEYCKLQYWMAAYSCWLRNIVPFHICILFQQCSPYGISKHAAVSCLSEIQGWRGRVSGCCWQQKSAIRNHQPSANSLSTKTSCQVDYFLYASVVSQKDIYLTQFNTYLASSMEHPNNVGTMCCASANSTRQGQGRLMVLWWCVRLLWVFIIFV